VEESLYNKFLKIIMRDGTVGEPPLAELAEIKPIEGGFEISIPNVDLDSEQSGKALVFEIELEKQPCHYQEGETIGPGSQSLIIDLNTNPTEKSEAMLQAAKEIGELPAEQRPRMIVDLIRSQVQYAYKAVIEQLKEDDPELAKWVEENSGIGSGWKSQKASDIVKTGYGVCKHLAGLAVILGQEAGLDASYEFNPAFSPELNFKNINRPDNGQPLFKSFPVGKSFNAAHAWVSYYVDGRWISADPSTMLVADNEVESSIFKEANYRVPAGLALNFEGLPTHVVRSFKSASFRPGESNLIGDFSINADRTLQIGDPDMPNAYTGPLKFTVTAPRNLRGPNVEINSIKLKS
jgi:hypothetical protein